VLGSNSLPRGSRLESHSRNDYELIAIKFRVDTWGAWEMQHAKRSLSPTPICPTSSPYGRAYRVSFIYLGTAIAFGRWVSELAQCGQSMRGIDCSFIVAADRPLSSELTHAGIRTLQITAVESLNPVSLALNFLRARRSILAFLEKEQPDLVVTLMPHVWTPLLTRAMRQRCRAYTTIVHDAVAHPGDRTGWLTQWLLYDGSFADSIIVLSRSVSEELARKRLMRGRKIVQLFHPDLSDAAQPRRRVRGDGPLRLLFFGRILPYKGLPLLTEAVELLKAEGVDIALGVAGAGEISPPLRHQLAALGAEVINRWIMDAETSELLTRYDAMACSHIEASQSGVAALAFGAAMPVVATPIGGLAEQVVPGETGVLATDISPRAFANAIRQLATAPSLYDRISQHLDETRQDRSMERFLADLVDRQLDRHRAESYRGFQQ